MVASELRGKLARAWKKICRGAIPRFFYDDDKVREDSMKEFVMYVSDRQVRNPLLSIPSSSSSEYG